jgi:hypothetical protein
MSWRVRGNAALRYAMNRRRSRGLRAALTARLKAEVASWPAILEEAGVGAK